MRASSILLTIRTSSDLSCQRFWLFLALWTLADIHLIATCVICSWETTILAPKPSRTHWIPIGFLARISPVPAWIPGFLWYQQKEGCHLKLLQGDLDLRLFATVKTRLTNQLLSLIPVSGKIKFYDCFSGSFNQYFRFFLTRTSTTTLVNYFIPTFIYTGMSWFSFTVPVNQVLTMSADALPVPTWCLFSYRFRGGWGFW